MNNRFKEIYITYALLVAGGFITGQTNYSPVFGIIGLVMLIFGWIRLNKQVK